jgi:5'-nucleotidase
MRILLTNDDGYAAPGLMAAFHALREFGTVSVVAPTAECSACSHKITMRRPITVERRQHEPFGTVHAVDGTPADCVRLAVAELLDGPIDLVVSGVNAGANSGVDVFYSGTVAGAREAAILNLPSIAFSQALRTGIEPDWRRVTELVSLLVPRLKNGSLPGPGFWTVNLPAPIPDDAHERIHHVPMESAPAMMEYDRVEHADGRLEFRTGGSYWTRDAGCPSDYTIIRDGGIAITAIPLHGKF